MICIACQTAADLGQPHIHCVGYDRCDCQHGTGGETPEDNASPDEE